MEQLRAVKRQLTARDDLLKDDDKAAPLVKASKDFLTKLERGWREKLHNPKAKVTYDILALRGAAARLCTRELASPVRGRRGRRRPPTQGVRDEFTGTGGPCRMKYEKEWKDLTESDLKTLNERAEKLAYPIVIVPAEKVQEKKEDMP